MQFKLSLITWWLAVVCIWWNEFGFDYMHQSRRTHAHNTFHNYQQNSAAVSSTRIHRGRWTKIARLLFAFIFFLLAFFNVPLLNFECVRIDMPLWSSHRWVSINGFDRRIRLPLAVALPFELNFYRYVIKKQKAPVKKCEWNAGKT